MNVNTGKTFIAFGVAVLVLSIGGITGARIDKGVIISNSIPDKGDFAGAKDNARYSIALDSTEISGLHSDLEKSRTASFSVDQSPPEQFSFNYQLWSPVSVQAMQYGAIGGIVEAHALRKSFEDDFELHRISFTLNFRNSSEFFELALSRNVDSKLVLRFKEDHAFMMIEGRDGRREILQKSGYLNINNNFDVVLEKRKLKVFKHNTEMFSADIDWMGNSGLSSICKAEADSIKSFDIEYESAKGRKSISVL